MLIPHLILLVVLVASGRLDKNLKITTVAVEEIVILVEICTLLFTNSNAYSSVKSSL